MSRQRSVRNHNKGRELNFLEKITFDLSSKRLACLGMAVYFFFVYGSVDEWYFKPVREVVTTLGGGNDAAPFYVSLFFLFFAVFGGVILKIYFGINAEKTRKPEPNIVKQTVVRDAKGGTIKGIISNLPAHLQELIRKR